MSDQQNQGDGGEPAADENQKGPVEGTDAETNANGAQEAAGGEGSGELEPAKNADDEGKADASLETERKRDLGKAEAQGRRPVHPTAKSVAHDSFISRMESAMQHLDHVLEHDFKDIDPGQKQGTRMALKRLLGELRANGILPPAQEETAG